MTHEQETSPPPAPIRERSGQNGGGSSAASNYQLVQLANGAWSVRSEAEGETFHPVIGPAAEAEELYVRQLNVPERLEASQTGLCVWDVGLGAAANVLTLLKNARDCAKPLHILSFDRTLEPLRFALDQQERLPYFFGFQDVVEAFLDSGRCAFRNGATPVVWEYFGGDFPSLLRSEAGDRWPSPNAVLFDAFSPARNPEMWTLDVFAGLRRRVQDGSPCALATYSRSTLLRVTLLRAGFWVGAGRATGEKEETTVAASVSELVARPLDRSWLERVRRSTSAEPLRSGQLYKQKPISNESWEALIAHPQFSSD